MSRVLEHMERYAELGLSLQFLCGPSCQAATHGRSGHPENMRGKIPIRGGWPELGQRSAAVLRSSYQDGYNLSILCGLQPTGLSVAVVDLDSEEAYAWALRHLPPTPMRTATRRREHWYYLVAPGQRVRPRDYRERAGSALCLDMELLGNGRQVVAPGSVHASGHVYREVIGTGEGPGGPGAGAGMPGEPWSAEALRRVPVFDPEWLDSHERRAEGVRGPRRSSGPSYAGGGTWPGQRRFTLDELAESRERILAYLTSPNTPVSQHKDGGDTTLHEVAIKVLRGFPVASPARLAALRAEGAATAAVDLQDALVEAVALLKNVWNPRCVDVDGVTPYPWGDERLEYKVGEAAGASRLPGADYWAFDDQDAQAAWRRHESGAAWLRAGEAASESSAARAGGGVGAAQGSGAAPAEVGGLPAGLWEALGVPGVAEGGAPAADAPGGSPGAAEAVPGGGGAELGAELSAGAARAEALDTRAPLAAPAAPPAPVLEARPGIEVFRPLDGGEAVPAHDGGMLRIEIDHDLERMARESVVALSRMEGVYVRQHVLVDVVDATGNDRHGMPRRPWIRKTSATYLKARLSSEVYWYNAKQGDRDEPPRVRADVDAVKTVLGAGSWPGVPAIEGVVYTPIVRTDGSILQQAGYDPAMRLIYRPEVNHGTIERSPSREKVERARDYLLKVVKDFPFEKPQVSRAVWLAAVLTRFCRYSYSGMSPMFSVSAREQGSGKGLLVDCAAIISDGRPADTMPFTGDEAEAKREIIAILSGDDTHHVALDNIAIGTKLSSAAYEAMLTGFATVGREVGTSEVKRIVMSDAVWWATGNYLEMGPDMARRSLRMDILDRSGNPAARRVDEDDLRAYCQANRGNLVRAALTVLAGFAAAGAPQARQDCDGVPIKGEFPSFGPWSRVVRQAVVWAGMPDPCRGVASADEDAAPDAHRQMHLVTQWVDAFGMDPIQTSEAARRMVKEAARHAPLVSYLADHGLTQITPVGLGRFLKNNMRGVCTLPDGRKLMLYTRQIQKGIVWGVREA